MPTFFILNILLYVGLSLQENGITFVPNEITLEKNVTTSVYAKIKDKSSKCQTYVFNYAYGESAISYNEDNPIIVPLSNVTLCGTDSNFSIQVTALKVGSVLVGASLLKNNSYELLHGFFKVTVIHLRSLEVLQQIIGWLYFLAWSLSFYPQVITNFQKKSVVGLSLDYAFLNVLGFLSYTIFNVSMFCIPSIQSQYLQLHPRGNIPVEPNDVAFSLHALLITAITALQCLVYERGTQKISILGKIYIIIIFTVSIITLFVAIGHVITWLVFVTIFSYVKLFITLVKYFPQVWLNFSRKSTDGWNLGNVILDFTGGVFSFAQMVIIASNNDDWTVMYGNITKLGLGLCAIFFDLSFFVQHCMYNRGSNQILYESI